MRMLGVHTKRQWLDTASEYWCYSFILQKEKQISVWGDTDFEVQNLALFLLYLPAPCSFWIALCSTNTANYFSCRRFHGILWTWNVLIIVHLLEITVISSPVLICSWQTAAALSALFYEYSPECLHFLAKWLEWLWFTNECLLSNATELTSYISSCQGPKPTLRAMCPTATITASNPCLQFVCRWVNRFFLRI